MTLSPRQSRILAFIEGYITANGFPPTHEEIRRGLGISSKSLVNYHLEALESAGELTRTHNTPRGIRLMTELELTALKRLHPLDARMLLLRPEERQAVEVLVVVLCEQIQADRATALDIIWRLGLWMRRTNGG